MCIRDSGYTTAETTALYGEYTFGMTLFMLPPSFIYPLSVSLMPAVSAALTRLSLIHISFPNRCGKEIFSLPFRTMVI